ncbi:MAG: endonuclease/exonuclease/phosphatase family protein [Chloroflexi bacterium]|nr:endonuclease/exonuclease/phosphatase family protein [Chloroflexota bacterium]
MRILTYNIQSGLGIDGVRDAARAGQLVNDWHVDIAALQEVELGSPRSGFHNQPRRLAEVTGMHQAFGHGFQRGPWRFGNCILSRFPIRSSSRHPLPGAGEPRSVLAAALECYDAPGGVLHVLCTHLGLDQTVRTGQVQEIKRVLAALDGPAVLAGDFNDFPGSPPLVELLEGSGLIDITAPDPTFPAPTPTAKIDYVFTRGLPVAGPSQVIASAFSDHLPVIVDVPWSAAAA